MSVPGNHPMSKSGFLAAVLFASLGVIPVHALAAGTCSGGNSVLPSGCTIQVTATIQNGCLITGGSGASFGILNFGTQPTQPAKTVNTALTGNPANQINCTPNMTLTMSIDSGLYYSSGRHVKLTSGSATMAYQIYADAAYQTPIGVNSPVTFSSGSSGLDIRLPIYGRLSIPGTTPPGIYNDTLTVTMSW